MSSSPLRFSSRRRAWVVDVNMGYGHSRAAYALRDLSDGEVISANDYPGIPQQDRKWWTDSRKLYETISRLKSVPIIGPLLFEALDRWQEIPAFYPRRDLSKPGVQLTEIYHLIQKGFGRHLIEALGTQPVPLITTFFVPAFMADTFHYPGEIYCVTTDADVSRTWAPLDPKHSRIRYIASNGRVAERLKLYGVREDHISLTGFPLPKELIGGPEASLLKDLMVARLRNLDPNGIFFDHYERTLRAELGERRFRMHPTHPLTVTYTVGGAGAQRQLGFAILQSLAANVARHELRLNLVAGLRKDIAKGFIQAARKLRLGPQLGEWITIPTFESRKDYFEGFSEILKTTDILWTKPSELSFYTGLGLAIIMAPPIGSQEEFNRVWLQYVGGGIPQLDVRYASEWLFDWLRSGGLARMAWSGYVEAPTHGTYRIEDVVLGHKSEVHPLPLIV
ncbi:MAG TPA: hypothetical protein VJB99_04405 [Patescibacteria group bacterium]|nr:hypothetical protein [Patescibacteria group bacterium]